MFAVWRERADESLPEVRTVPSLDNVIDPGI
jgi:hypothetical protein